MDEKITVDNIPDFIKTKKSGILSIWKRNFTVAGTIKIKDLVVCNKDKEGYAQVFKTFENSPKGEQELVEYLNVLILRDNAEPIWIKGDI